VNPERRAAALLVLASLLWGATFVAIHDLVARVDAVTLVFVRFAIASVVLLPLGAARGRRSAAAIRAGALSGVLGALGFVCQAIGLHDTTPATSAFITATGSLFAGLFAWPLLHQRPTAALLVGIAVAIAGAALLTPPTGLGLGVGESWTALGAIAFGLQIVVLARFAPGADPLAVTAFQALSLALVVAPFGARGLGTAPHGGDVWLRLGYLVVAGSIIAPLCQITAQRTLPAGRVGLLLGLEPVFAAVFAVTLAGERPSHGWWLGATLILLAVSFVEWSATRASDASPRPTTAGTSS